MNSSSPSQPQLDTSLPRRHSACKIISVCLQLVLLRSQIMIQKVFFSYDIPIKLLNIMLQANLLLFISKYMITLN